MNNPEITKLMAVFARSRGNLLLLVAFTTINLLVAASGFGFALMFSAALPRLIFQFGSEWTAYYGHQFANNIGIVLAFIVAFLYCLCWLLSKKHGTFMLVALIFFSVDTALFLLQLLAIFLTAGFNTFILIHLAFHAWMMYYLIVGTGAWVKLRRMTPGRPDKPENKEE